MLIRAAQDHWPVMFANIAMRRALNAGRSRTLARSSSFSAINAALRCSS